MNSNLKIGDTVSYQELTGKIRDIVETPRGLVLSVYCPTNDPNGMDVELWVPESELLLDQQTK